MLGLVAVFIVLTGSAVAEPSLSKLAKQVKDLKAKVDAFQPQPGPPGPQGLQGLQGTPGAAAPPSGAAGGDLTGSYPNPTLDTAAVDSAKVLDNSLTGADISDNGGAGTIASVDIANNSVASGDILNGTIAAADLVPNTLTGAEIDETTLNVTLPQAFVTNNATNCNPTFAAPSKICATTNFVATHSQQVLLLGSGSRTVATYDDPANPSDDPNSGFGDCFLRVDAGGIGMGVAHFVSVNPVVTGGDYDNFPLVGISFLTAGAHTIDMQCDEGDGDLQIAYPTVAAVQLGT